MTAGSDSGDEEEWQFSIEDLEEREETHDPASEEHDDRSGNVAGGIEHEQPLEPGEIDLENALFVTLGVLLVVGLFVAVMFGL